MNNLPAVIACDQLSKTYTDGGITLEVLRDIHFSVYPGELVVIMGSSGSGKSTLLHLLGGLDRPESGRVTIAGQNPFTLSERARCRLRNRHLGFVYQFHHLLPEFTALENVSLPLLLRGESPASSIPVAKKLLEAVGLENRMSHRPGELSGGERQRVAIARALVGQPDCILADEPTGNLDPRNAEKVLALLFSLQQKHQTAVVLVTHDQAVAQRAGRLFSLEQGCLVAQK